MSHPEISDTLICPWSGGVAVATLVINRNPQWRRGWKAASRSGDEAQADAAQILIVIALWLSDLRGRRDPSSSSPSVITRSLIGIRRESQ